MSSHYRIDAYENLLTSSRFGAIMKISCHEKKKSAMFEI